MGRRRPIDYVKAGYADFLDQTPWRRSPVTYEDWVAGAADTDESNAYWSGWYAALEDAIQRAS